MERAEGWPTGVDGEACTRVRGENKTTETEKEGTGGQAEAKCPDLAALNEGVWEIK